MDDTKIIDQDFGVKIFRKIKN